MSWRCGKRLEDKCRAGEAEYIRTSKDKQVVDPDPHKIYSRRKEKQGTTSEPDTETIGTCYI